MGRVLSLVCAAFLAAAPHLAEAQSSTSQLRSMERENDALVWRAVGRLDAKATGFCTATLIAPDLVLTAAHCVYDRRTHRLLTPEELTFRAGLRQGEVAAERQIAQVEAHPNYRSETGITPQNVSHDVALLRLAQPIPTSELDPFVLHNRTVSKGPVSVVSYGRGRATMPSRQDVCQVMAARDGIMMMDCDVTFGSSGAPVFSHFNGRGQIVSVISGMGFYDGRRITYGMVLPDLVAELKRQMYANKPRPVAKIRRLQVGSDGATRSAGGAKFLRADGS